MLLERAKSLHDRTRAREFAQIVWKIPETSTAKGAGKFALTFSSFGIHALEQTPRLQTGSLQHERKKNGKHCIFYHRYHVVWSTKYRFKVLRGDVQRRIREIIRRVCRENGVDIISGVVSSDHVHMFVSIPSRPPLS